MKNRRSSEKSDLTWIFITLQIVFHGSSFNFKVDLFEEYHRILAVLVCAFFLRCFHARHRQVRHAPSKSSKSSKLIYQQLSLKANHEQFTSPILWGYGLTWRGMWNMTPYTDSPIPQSWFLTGIITYNLHYIYIYTHRIHVWYIC